MLFGLSFSVYIWGALDSLITMSIITLCIGLVGFVLNTIFIYTTKDEIKEFEDQPPPDVSSLKDKIGLLEGHNYSGARSDAAGYEYNLEKYKTRKAEHDVCMFNKTKAIEFYTGLRNKFRIVLVIGVLLTVLIPRPNTFAAMVILPSIAESELIQKDFPELYEAAMNKLKESLGVTQKK